MYIVRRLIMLIPIMLGVILLTFLIIKVTPGDPVMRMLGKSATPERIAQVREQYGLDDPVVVQFFRYIWKVVHGDLGISIHGQSPVLQDILARLPSTAELALSAVFLAVVLGVGLGVVAAIASNRFVENFIMVTSMIGLSIPVFWLGLILLMVFGVTLKWVSVSNSSGIKDLILPSICMAVGSAAMLARLTRSSILEVMNEDYVRTARAKGIKERVVIVTHVLPNALIPVVTTIGMMFANMLGGAVFLEVIFARPGLGKFAINAIANRDYPQIQGMVLFLAFIFVLINLLVDILYGILDPRIRYD